MDLNRHEFELDELIKRIRKTTTDLLHSRFQKA